MEMEMKTERIWIRMEAMSDCMFAEIDSQSFTTSFRVNPRV